MAYFSSAQPPAGASIKRRLTDRARFPPGVELERAAASIGA
jgi:hypothetical protein